MTILLKGLFQPFVDLKVSATQRSLEPPDIAGYRHASLHLPLSNIHPLRAHQCLCPLLSQPALLGLQLLWPLAHDQRQWTSAQGESPIFKTWQAGRGPLLQMGHTVVSGGVPVPAAWTSNMHPHPSGVAPTYMSSGRRRDAGL